MLTKSIQLITRKAYTFFIDDVSMMINLLLGILLLGF